jgi:hypothetical protein
VFLIDVEIDNEQELVKHLVQKLQNMKVHQVEVFTTKDFLALSTSVKLDIVVTRLCSVCLQVDALLEASCAGETYCIQVLHKLGIDINTCKASGASIDCCNL